MLWVPEMAVPLLEIPGKMGNGQMRGGYLPFIPLPSALAIIYL